MKTGSETCTVILMNWTSQPPEMSFSILCVHLLFDYLVNFELGGVPIVSDKPYFEGKKTVCVLPPIFHSVLQRGLSHLSKLDTILFQNE